MIKYELTDGLTLLQNKTDWEKWNDSLPGRDNVYEPESYPVLAWYVSHEGNNGYDVTDIQYVYPKDAAQLITAHWELEDAKLAEENIE